MGRDEYRRRVREVDERMAGRPYSRAYLAGEVGLDPKTNRRYLVEYEVGWPPFNNGPMQTYWAEISSSTTTASFAGPLLTPPSAS
jgi:hypothetical protein